MKEKTTLHRVENRDTRPAAIGSVWWAALAMLGVCIPLVAIMKSAIFPVLVIGGAVVATVVIWKSSQERVATSEKEAEEMRERIRDLEERLANVEVINSFEERLAEKEAQKERSRVGPEEEEEVLRAVAAAR